MEKNRQVILINPWIHDFTAYDLWLKPLGLLYIGSYLEKHGYKVQLIDCLEYKKISKSYGCSKFYSEEITKPCYFQNIPRKYKRYGIPPTQFTRILMQIKEQTQPILIAVTSMMTYWYPGVFDTIKYIKQVFDDTPVVLGGVYATLCYEHAKKYSGADYVIKGGGEEEILNIARKFTRLNSQSAMSLSRGTRGNSQFLFPAYHLYNWDREGNKSIAMLTSKGCPFRCSYCASSSLFSGFIQRPPEDVISEIEYYQKSFDITDIAFYDDALLVNAESHIHPILDGIVRQGLNKKLRFHTPNGLHIKYMDKPLTRKLYQANFKTIRLGFENLDDPKASKEQLAQAINNLKMSGFNTSDIGVYILMGLPDQSLEEIERTIEFVHQCGALIKIAQYSPVPHSSDFGKVTISYPEIATEPLLQNKSVYYYHNKSAKFQEFETIKLNARRLNTNMLKNI